MKNLFFLFSIIILFGTLSSYSLSPESSPSDSFEALFLPLNTQKIILNREKYVLILTNSSYDYGEIKELLLLMGYDSKEVLFSSQTFTQIKNSIDSVIYVNEFPQFILIIGDEYAIPSLRERVNPYTKNIYSTDFDYGMFSEDISSSVPVARIPAKNQLSLDKYTTNLKNLLFSNESTQTVLLAPFYDFDNDSVEDYLYYTHSYKISEFLPESRILSETNSLYPKYLYDYTQIDDTLTYPFYNWSVAIDEISSYSPLILSYRGHGNPISMVLPEIPLSEMSQINLSMGGSLFTFTCLLSAFDSFTSGFKSCFAESVLFLENGFSSVIGFSSETFYQYNNFLLNLFFDHLNDNIFTSISSAQNSTLLKIIDDCKINLLSVYGFNDYTESQIVSMQFLGFPAISPAKLRSLKPFFVQKTIFTGDTLIHIILYENASFYLSNKINLYDSLPHIAGEYFIKAENLDTLDTLYGSSYFNGILFVDTIEIHQNEISLTDVSLSDSTGDNDGLIESGERVLFSFKMVPSDFDLCILSCDYPAICESLASDSVGNFSFSFIIPKDAEEIHLKVSADIFTFFWSFLLNRYTVNLLEMKSMDSPFIFSGEKHQMLFEFTHFQFFNTACTLSFIKSYDYTFTLNYPMVMSEFDTAVFFNEMLFLSDSFDLMIEYKCNLFTDTMSIPFKCSKRNSLFIYDPKNQYLNSKFTSFLQDSLNCEIIIQKNLIDSQFYPANIFAFGIYPNNDELDSSEAAYIQRASSYNSSILLDGGDALGYDNAGESLIPLFNISSAEDGPTIYAGNQLSFPSFDITLEADTTIKFIDTYTSVSPFLFFNDFVIGSFSENRLAQSYPLTKLKSIDNNWLYYIYASVLLDYDFMIDYPLSANLTFKREIIIINISITPLMIKILNIPSFFDSIKFKNSRVILPFSYDTMIFFINRDAPSFSTEILFTTGFDTMGINVIYNLNSNPKTITAKVTASGYSFEIEEDGFLILPAKAEKTCFIKKCGNRYTIFGDIKQLDEERVIFKTQMGDIIIQFPKIPQKKKQKEIVNIYNLLGEKTKIKSSGIYFTNKRKFVHIK